MSSIERIRAIAEPLADARGFQIYDVTLRSDHLRVTVTGAVRVPGVDDLGAISRELSSALDREDLVPGRYTLEVSTPGIERELRAPEHFQGALGEKVSIRWRGPEGLQRLRAALLGADEAGITIQPEPSSGSEPTAQLSLPYAEIEQARTVFEWGPDPASDRDRAGARSATRRSQR